MVMQEITECVERGRAGDREGARSALGAVWDRLGEDGDPLHVATLAHFMADLQDEPAEELAWDHRALAAADRLTDERAQQYEASLAVRGLYPSLYASLAADYAKLDDASTARRYLTRAEAATPDLPESEYGEYVRAVITRLRAQLDDDPDRPGERP
jgi:hypothetical protein